MHLEHLLSDAIRGAVVLGVALASMPLLRRASAATRRLVLAFALGGALVLPALSALVPAWHVRPPAAVATLTGLVTMERPVDADVAPGNAPREAPQAAPLPARPLVDATTALVVAWALGALVVLARLVTGLARARAMVRRSAPARGWARALARAERASGVRAIVRESDEVDAPAVTGLFGAPVVLVPRAAASWSDERRSAVLLHELAHARRKDCLVHVVAQLALAVHWFDPLAWLAVRRLRVERELAADDAVIAAGVRASAYAVDLLAIAGVRLRARAMPSGALGMADGSELAARVTSIVAEGRPRTLARWRAALLASGSVSVLLAAACATPSTTPAARSPLATNAPVATAGAHPSTIDPELQAFADGELDRAMSQWQANAGTIVVLDPRTGQVLVDAGRDHGAAADVALRSVYLTGSTIKAITLSAAIEEQVLSPDDRIDCEHGKWTYDGKTMTDARPNGVLTVTDMLAVSTNIGFTKVFDRLGGNRLGRWLRAFHFGAAPTIEGAASGSVPDRIEDKSYAGALAAIGEGVTASPLQVAAAYATIANDGAYVAPTFSRDASPTREAILKPETARAVRAILEGAVASELSTAKLARLDGVRVAGKTGTAGWDLPDGGEGVYASFVGIVPANAPRYVVLVGVEQPKGAEGGGGQVAAPVFARVAARALARAR